MADAKQFNFTTTRLKALKHQEARYEVRDDDVKGLVLRVAPYPSTVKTFSVFRWVKATQRPERVTLGKYPELSIDAARTQAKAIIAAIADNKSPATERTSYRASDTFEVVFNKYMDNHVRPHLSKKAEVDFQGLFDNHIKPSRLHLKKLVDISHGDVEALHIKIGKTRKTTANKVAGLIRAVYRHAAKHKVQVPIPTVGLRKFDLQSRDRFLQSDELPRFYAALAETPQPFRDFFRLLMLTGVRLSNMLAARFDQFDLDNALWTIPGSQHKNKKPHSMPLGTEALEVVRRRAGALPAGAVWLWPSTGRNPGKTGHLVHVRDEWADLLRRAEITNLRRHDLRRTLGSWMAIGGTSLPIIGKQLGHVSQQSTQVYARLSLDPGREAMEATLAKMDAAGASRAKPA